MIFRRVPLPRCCYVLEEIGGGREGTIRTCEARGRRCCELKGAYEINKAFGRPPSVPSIGDNRFSTLSRYNSVVTVCMNRSRGGGFVNACGGISLNFAPSSKFGTCNGEAGHNIEYFVLSRGRPSDCGACSEACRSLINGGISEPIFSCLSDGTPAAISTTVPVVIGAVNVVTTVVVLVVLLTGFLWLPRSGGRQGWGEWQVCTLIGGAH